MTLPSSEAKEFLEFLETQSLNFLAVGQRPAYQHILLFLKPQNALFDSIANNETLHLYISLLTQAVHAVDRLLLGSGAPPRVNHEHEVRARKGEPEASCLQRQ